jgi:branched-chain amino acid transport system ATP-binding protein
MIALIRDTVVALKETGVATILVEQRVDAALSVADRIAFISGGQVAETVDTGGMTEQSPQFAAYVGV